MKLIHNYKSPNFNDRKSSNIELIIIHYTALKSINDSLKYLCSRANKVSSHYLISKKGKIYSLVSEKKRAWHAGQSYWKGKKDINSISIGIELDYCPSFKKNKFSNDLNSSLLILLKKIIKKYKILPENILGHSDIAPYRKIDPGKNFPWYLIENEGLAFKIKAIKKDKFEKILYEKSIQKNQFKSKKKKILFMLNYIGYDISKSTNNNYAFNQLINAYSHRHWYYKNFNYNKNNIFYVIELHFFNLILTKLKK